MPTLNFVTRTAIVVLAACLLLALVLLLLLNEPSASGTNDHPTTTTSCPTDNGLQPNGGTYKSTTTTTMCPPPSTTSTTEAPTTTSTTESPSTTSTTNAANQTLLSLRAVVINRFGGTATTADFDLFANGPVRISGVTGNPAVTRALVPAGTYNLSDVEDALAEATDPYATSGWDCSGSADTTPESVTLDTGEVAVCTVVFSDAPAPSGGTAVAPTPTGSSSTGAAGSPSQGFTTFGTVPPGQPGAGEIITNGGG